MRNNIVIKTGLKIIPNRESTSGEKDVTNDRYFQQTRQKNHRDIYKYESGVFFLIKQTGNEYKIRNINQQSEIKDLYRSDLYREPIAGKILVTQEIPSGKKDEPEKKMMNFIAPYRLQQIHIQNKCTKSPRQKGLQLLHSIRDICY